jgi:hypothetical protein
MMILEAVSLVRTRMEFSDSVFGEHGSGTCLDKTECFTHYPWTWRPGPETSPASTPFASKRCKSDQLEDPSSSIY